MRETDAHDNNEKLGCSGWFAVLIVLAICINWYPDDGLRHDS